MAKLMDSSAGIAKSPRGNSNGYCCLLDDQPTHLVPERLVRRLRQEQAAGDLNFNARCSLGAAAGETPDGVCATESRLTEDRSEDLTVAWVQDGATEVWSPFGLSNGLRDVVLNVRSDAREIRGLQEPIKNLLQQAGILIAQDHEVRRCRMWGETASRCRSAFREQGYAVVDGLLHPFQLAELRRYFRRQIRAGKMRLGDGQSPLRYIAHNDPAAGFFHGQLTKAVSDLVGERVKPSYVYMASYLSGAQLERHTDREQCEFSITLCLDYAPEPSGATPWPLYLDTPRGTATIHQAIGDGLLYRGRELPHYRKTLARGNTSTSLFLHYVAEDFDGALE